MKLFLKLVRDMKQSIGQLISFVLIIAVGAFFYAGLVAYSSNLSTYSEEYFQKHNLSDLYVYYDHVSESDVDRLGEIEGIANIEGRYTFDVTHVFEGENASLKIHSIPIHNEINTPAMVEGTIPQATDEIIVDSRYAAEHRIQVGDQISVSANEQSYTFTVSGLCENVEYVKKNETQDHKAFGIAYMADAAIPEIAGSHYFNEVLIDAMDGYDIDQLGQSIEEQSKQEQLAYVDQISKERSFSYSKIQETIYNNNLMSKVIPFVLFVIEAIILFLAMSRIMDSERKQVGIMKALGVNNRKIMLHYMGYPLLVSIIGSIVGCVIAGLVFIPYVTESSARSYSLPGITFSLSYFSVIPPILFSSAFGMLACYFSGRAILKEHAAQAMRPKPPKTMKKLWIEKVPGIWRNIPYSYKLVIRNLWLNKQKALVSSVGVVVSTVLLITAFGTQSSLLKVAGQAEKVYPYDLRVDYSPGTTADQMEMPPGTHSRYLLAHYPIELIQEGEHENAALIVTERENGLIQYFDEHENKISLEDGGVLVPKSYADIYNIAEGETIQIQFSAPELERKSIDMKVLGITTQYSDPSFYVTPDYLQSFGIEYSPTTVLIQAVSQEHVEDIRRLFEQDPRVDTITDQRDLKEKAQYIVKQNSFIFIMFIVSAVILSFSAIYTISSINVYERSRELATLKVLGYQKYKINRLIFMENIILTILAVIVALPVSGYFFELIVKALSSTHQQIPDQLNVLIIIMSVILAFVLTILSNFMLRRKVSGIHMIESLKSVE